MSDEDPNPRAMQVADALPRAHRPALAASTERPCGFCGRPCGRMMCLACRTEREAKHEQQLAEMDRLFRAFLRQAKERGSWDHADRRWMVANGHADTVKALEERWKREGEKPGGRVRTRSVDAAGFARKPRNDQ